MKNYRIILVLIALIASIFSLPKCEKADCFVESRELTESEKLLIPIQFGEVKYYTNHIKTYMMKCIQRGYNQGVDFYVDHYYYDQCGSQGLERKYWVLSTRCTTNIPYTDSTQLIVGINVETFPDQDKNATFNLRLYDSPDYFSTEQYSFFTRPDTSYRVFLDYSPGVGWGNRCDMDFKREMTINHHKFKNVTIFSGEITNFDSVYYNNEFGIIRLVGKLKLDLVF